MLTNLSLNIGAPSPEPIWSPALPPGAGAPVFAATMLNLAANPQAQPNAAAAEHMPIAKPIVARLLTDAAPALPSASDEKVTATVAGAVPSGLPMAAPEQVALAKQTVARVPADIPPASPDASVEGTATSPVESHDPRIHRNDAASQVESAELESDAMVNLFPDMAIAAGPAYLSTGPSITLPPVAADAVAETLALRGTEPAVQHSPPVRGAPTVASNSNALPNAALPDATAGNVRKSNALFSTDLTVMGSPDAASFAEPTMAVSFTALPIGSHAAGPEIMRPSLTPERHLDLSNDGAWLGELASDIALASSDEGILNFRLLPKQLGLIEVSIEPGANGLIIHVAAETEAARTLLVAANPRLLSELGQSGVSVENASYGNLGQQDASLGGQSRREQQTAPLPHPLVNPPMRTRPAERGTFVPSRPGRFA